MEKNKVQEMIEIFQKSGLAKLEYSEENAGKRFTICLKAQNTGGSVQPVVEKTVPQVENIIPQPVAQARAVDFKHAVASPMIGVFYTAPSPTDAPFVEVGSKVKKGDVICIIEAMKLMNEIVAEHDGTIVEICAKNGDLVEFGQELFKIL